MKLAICLGSSLGLPPKASATSLILLDFATLRRLISTTRFRRGGLWRSGHGLPGLKPQFFIDAFTRRLKRRSSTSIHAASLL